MTCAGVLFAGPCVTAWMGNGRKAGWYSPFLLAVWDPEREEYSSMCRCMSGFTDVFYADRTARFSQPDVLLPCRPAYYDTLESPDVWFAPTEVWEVRTSGHHPPRPSLSCERK